MNFKEAFAVMKSGGKVKLPSWGGYWFWDTEKGTIMIQCRPEGNEAGELLDIRDTKDVEYTTMNLLSDEWIVANEENCQALGGKATFSFSEAIKHLKRGKKVARKGWNEKGHYLFVAAGEDLTACLSSGDFKCESAICVKISLDNVGIGWNPSQADMLAEDWVFVDESV